MRSNHDCIPCLVKQAIAAARKATDIVADQDEAIRRALRITADADLSDSPPFIAGHIYGAITDATGNRDPFRVEKDRSNQQALALYPALKERIAASGDPFLTALRLAIAGNIIDFGVPEHGADVPLEMTIEHAMEADLPMETVEELRTAIANAEHILYLGDNTGEIVMDRLFVEQMPTDKVTFVVRGRPIINDATMVDAETVGLTDVVNVIDNNTGYPGTVLSECSDELRQKFDEADVVISKGQGNFETLTDANRDIFFLLKVKCHVVSQQLDRPLGDIVLLRR